MTNYSKTLICILACSMTIIITNLINTISIKESIEYREVIEKRAYKKLTKENKELIEYIVFGENQE